MTPKEAFYILNNTIIRFSRGNGKTLYFRALAKAEEALEKQIPKKPIPFNWVYRCPDCNAIVVQTDYCSRCGQALDWTEDNE